MPAVLAAIAGVMVGSPATAVPNPGGVDSPGVVAPGSAAVWDQQVFETGLDSSVIRWRYGDSPTQRSSLGGYAIGGPAATMVNDDTIVVVQGRDHALWINEQENGSRWSGWRSLGGRTTDRPAIGVRWPDLVLAVRGTDGVLWERARKVGGSEWGPWRRDGQPLAGAPGFDTVRDADGRVWTRESAGWSRLAALPNGLQADSEPYRTTRDEVLVLGSDAQCWIMTDGSWSSLGGQFVSGFAKAETSDGIGTGQWVYGRGLNGRLYVQGFNHPTWTMIG